MSRTIAIYGGSFNPPGLHHREAAERLRKTLGFSEVVVIPCGPRPDKSETNAIEPSHRAAMADLNFSDLAETRVDLRDLERGRFTPAVDLAKQYAEADEVWHVVSEDLIKGGRSGESAIQTSWTDGRNFWRQGRFVVLVPPGSRIDPEDLPPRHRILQIAKTGRSPVIRKLIYERKPYHHLVHPAVASYIDRHILYVGAPPLRQFGFKLNSESLRCLVVTDERNPKSLQAAAALQPFASDNAPPNLVVAIGGDGTMLHAIRQHWRKRLPFYGINTGHRGFLLNDENPDSVVRFVNQELTVYSSPLLYAETETLEGRIQSELAFNDAWVERTSGQTAWLRLEINGQERFAKLVADGLLVATPAGSTSYARAMGSPPLPLNTPALILAGSNVLEPMNWRPALLASTTRIRIQTLDPIKRPLQAFVDGVPQGAVRAMDCRISKIAAVELAFVPEHDPALKLAQIQFPAER